MELCTGCKSVNKDRYAQICREAPESTIQVEDAKLEDRKRLCSSAHIPVSKVAEWTSLIEVDCMEEVKCAESIAMSWLH